MQDHTSQQVSTTRTPDEMDGFGSGRLRRVPLSRLSKLRQPSQDREEDVPGGPPDRDMSPLSKSDYDTGLVTEADWEAARAWLRDFRSGLDPDVLAWLDGMCRIRDYDPEPWPTWETFLDSLGPNRRAWLADRGVRGIAGEAPAP